VSDLVLQPVSLPCWQREAFELSVERARCRRLLTEQGAQWGGGPAGSLYGSHCSTRRPDPILRVLLLDWGGNWHWHGANVARPCNIGMLP
jgi:hypothetical protein